MERPIRILIAKAGLDGHDRGAKVVAASLRDAGFEVIYTGLRQTPEAVVRAAIQEDVDAIGLSILSGAHMTLFPKIQQLLKDEGAERILLFGGGVIPAADATALEKQGIGRIFPPGTDTNDIVTYLREEVSQRRKT
ncbi:MAG: cobalamin B12-binding domain-containing protein [Planctomycetes bacterium]|nr:cobalamin B12-binding domain-containing protein [Planctomycetota bacterium]NUQ33750.1 cobalamin B12-binding domain-containing protein [Planctomycetaceae bacterium]